MKMLISEWYHIPVWTSLAVIAVVLTVSIVVSVRYGGAGDPSPGPDETAEPQAIETDGDRHQEPRG